jgi:predicted O-linked N-acetylglucosamine transferase (SPINDLY family)
MTLQGTGRLDLAEPIYRSILDVEPTHGAANHCLGLLLVQLRRPALGLPHLLAALQVNPEIADYWLGYLEALLLLGRNAEAASTLAMARRHGLQGRAADEFAHRLESRTSRHAAHPTATGSDRTTAPLEPSRATRRREAALIGREETALLALINERRFDEALPVARDMTERHPEHGTAWKILGAMLWAAASPDQALNAMLTSVRLLPGDAEAHTNLGSALTKMQRLDDAELVLRRALEIDPEFAAGHSHIGVNLQLQGRYAEAQASFRCAIQLSSPNFVEGVETCHTNLLFTLNHDPTVTAKTLFAEHRRVGAYLEGGIPRSRPSHSNLREPERCLRIGFVSADLRDHAVASFVEPLFRQWQNHENLKMTVYYSNPTEDEVSRRLRAYVSRWRGVFGLPEAQLSSMIEDDGIDILIDLAGHTAFHRLRAFAHRPAPVQASWLGYPATTGLHAMDYYLTDRHFLPPGQFDCVYTEKLVYLPAAWTFQPCETAPPVNRLPALESGSLTFGSFNRLGKINQATVELWSQLLRALPDARMIIAGVPLEQRHLELIDWFRAAGVERERLTFHPWTTQAALLVLHLKVDIALEPTPYSGCTSNNHALWMGVPTLTLAGSTPASRLSAANLGHLGLEEFIATSCDDFAAKGLYWASNLQELADLRAGLRARWRCAPARQAGFVADGMERALRHMWRRWCAGLPPESFDATAPLA